MGNKVESENMEAQHPRRHDKQTDEVTPAVSQVIPLHPGRASLTPPVPPDELQTVIANSSGKNTSDDELKDPLIGNRVAGYVVEAAMSAGGMGVVYRARQPDIGRCVAIKVLRPEIAVSEDQSNRFFKEAQALSAIRHRGVTDIIQWGRLSDKRQYIVMEYLEGENLEDVMGRDGAMPVYRVIQIIGEVLDALSAAHKTGVVHRDLKPSNIFIAKQSDGTQCVKLLDFGLARQVPVYALDAQDAKLEKASMVAGTPEYIAPEQAKGLAATPRTDIYSLGVLTFEMLAGKLPFQTQSTVEMMRAHAYNEAPDIRDHAESIPSTLAELLTAMLKKSPDDRPRSTDEVKQRLRRISQQLKDEDTQGGIRLPRRMLEEQLAEELPAKELPKEKKIRKLWWPIAALPLVAGIGMYAGLVVAPSNVVNPAENTTPVAETTPLAAAVPNAAITSDVVPPPVEQPQNDAPQEEALVVAIAPVPGNNTPKPPANEKKPQPPPKSKTVPVAPAASAAVVLPVRLLKVDCNTPLWANAMKEKLRDYRQQLNKHWGDTPASKAISGEYVAFQSKINSSDGSTGTCAKTSSDLDQWLNGRMNPGS